MIGGVHNITEDLVEDSPCVLGRVCHRLGINFKAASWLASP